MDCSGICINDEMWTADWWWQTEADLLYCQRYCILWDLHYIWETKSVGESMSERSCKREHVRECMLERAGERQCVREIVSQMTCQRESVRVNVSVVLATVQFWDRFYYSCSKKTLNCPV